jgi:phospholipase C
VALLMLLAANLHAQPHFDHVIIIIQENRTPDNLFGASGLPGADLQINPLGNPESLGALNEGPGNGHDHAAFLTQVAGEIPNTAYNYITSGADPYWSMAAQYGFANYMYQTNQGGSLPAHQFLVSATSAPSDTSDLFVSDNSIPGQRGETCKAPQDARVPTIAPNGDYGEVYPCFQRASLMDEIENAGLTWNYYAISGESLWDAPLALQNYYKSQNNVLNSKEVLADVKKGNLANVSWVTPGHGYSDHPGGGGSGGPAWVSSIVNAVGKSQYWKDTAILVTWDDWGGWADHVAPLKNDTGWCEIYCYSFRVPLLVISAYTPKGHVDNGTYDFGSILRFVENNFGLSLIGPGDWADSYTGDLSSFFEKEQTRREFVPIKARPLTDAELADTGPPDDDY